MSSNGENGGRIHSVTPEYFGRPDREMDIIGWVIFTGLIVLLVPLLPFLIIVWVIDRLTNRTNRRPE